MGYEKFLKPTKEAIEELRRYACRRDENLSEQSKLDLCLYCMLDHSDKGTHTVISDIERLLRYIEYSIRGEVFRDTVKRCEKDDELVYCGWEYSRDEPDLDIDEHRQMTLKSLSTFAIVVKTPDYFKEQELFYDKMEDITSEIDAFCDTCVTCTDFEIIGKLAEMGIVDKYDDCADDNDDTLDNGCCGCIYEKNDGTVGCNCTTVSMDESVSDKGFVSMTTNNADVNVEYSNE